MEAFRPLIRYLWLFFFIPSIGFIYLKTPSQEDNRYWIWAGFSTYDAPAEGILYIYQGAWVNGIFSHKGIYPFPATQKEIHLVYRIEGPLPGPIAVAKVYLQEAAKWEKHGVKVLGLQIDYDCPSRKLLAYQAFLKGIRNRTDPSYQLSITGLCDWIASAKPKDLHLLGTTVDEIIFQLYHHTDYIDRLEQYLKRLGKIEFPYGLGLLYSKGVIPVNLDKHPKNPYYKGSIYFIHKRSFS